MQTHVLHKQAKRDGMLPIRVSFNDLVASVNKLSKKERENFLEDLLAATCPEYLQSIREARQDFKDDKILSHEQVFKDLV